MLRPVTWEPELEELRRREELARRMGGEERVSRQHASGRLTVRERIERLFDAESFRETGALAGRGTYEDGELVDFLPANCVVGRGRIDGRPAVVQGDDFTVRGGAADAAIWQKMVYAEELGGARAQTRAGAVDNEAADEDDALAQLKRFLSYLPSNVWDTPPLIASPDPPDRRAEELLSIVPREPRKPYKPRRILHAVFDTGSVFELGARYGRSLITALARLDGRPVAVLCSDPGHYAGGLTADASEKLTRFVDMADQFRVPVVNFVDPPGFVIGTEAERRGTIRRGTRALTAVYQASVPWASVLVRKAFGVAGAPPEKPEA